MADVRPIGANITNQDAYHVYRPTVPDVATPELPAKDASRGFVNADPASKMLNSDWQKASR